MKKTQMPNDVVLRKRAASELLGQRVRFIADVMSSGRQDTYCISHIDRNGFVGIEGLNGLWSPFILEAASCLQAEGTGTKTLSRKTADT